MRVSALLLSLALKKFNVFIPSVGMAEASPPAFSYKAGRKEERHRRLYREVLRAQRVPSYGSEVHALDLEEEKSRAPLSIWGHAIPTHIGM